MTMMMKQMILERENMSISVMFVKEEFKEKAREFKVDKSTIRELK